MKLTALELAIIIDTISGSLQISDGGRLFRYAEFARKDLLAKLRKIAENATTEVENEKH